MANSTETALLNPSTPMAFLPPDLAYQMTVTAYVAIGGLAVLVWDIITHLYADWKLLTRYKVALPTIVYFLSRLSTLAYMLVGTIFQTAPTGNCEVVGETTCTIYHVTVSSTALLFFLRVRAIFNKNRYITAIFFLLWIGVLGGSLTVVTSLSGVPIGNTKYCTFSNFKPYRSTANIIVATFDTSVFIAVTWRLSFRKAYTKGGGRTFDFFGQYLPSFTRALLQDGQKYYMVATVSNLLVLIMDFAPGIPIAYRTILLMPTIALGNIMACSVFRHTKMCQMNEGVEGAHAVILGKNLNVTAGIPSKTESSVVSDAKDETQSSSIV
ncbi:hypothetical protein BDZ94DRAFT_225354 [Collybia nuda]|uniref:Uncharacterized protein n=1 Tax=Collybia nuda TaxID=64659 RepID=A0A9P5XXR1_9AGAR|nr:hypothetical protein BDZ94DRAFT_225354 [Collybia nuda]